MKSNNEFEMLSYIESLITSNEAGMGLKLLKKIQFPEKYHYLTIYLEALGYVKINPPNYDMALALINSLTELNNAADYLRLFCLYEKGEYEEVIESHLSNHKTAVSAQNEQMYLLYAMSYAKLNLINKAKKAYRMIVEFNPINSIALNNYIALSMKCGGEKEFLDCINYADAEQIPELCNNLAMLFFSKGNVNEGSLLFEKGILSLNENLDMKYKLINNYSNQLIRTQNYSQCEVLLKKHLHEDPTGIQILLYGRLLDLQGRFEEKLDVFTDFLKSTSLTQNHEIVKLVEATIKEITKQSEEVELPVKTERVHISEVEPELSKRAEEVKDIISKRANEEEEIIPEDEEINKYDMPEDLTTEAKESKPESSTNMKIVINAVTPLNFNVPKMKRKTKSHSSVFLTDKSKDNIMIELSKSIAQQHSVQDNESSKKAQESNRLHPGVMLIEDKSENTSYENNNAKYTPEIFNFSHSQIQESPNVKQVERYPEKLVSDKILTQIPEEKATEKEIESKDCTLLIQNDEQKEKPIIKFEYQQTFNPNTNNHDNNSVADDKVNIALSNEKDNNMLFTSFKESVDFENKKSDEIREAHPKTKKSSTMDMIVQQEWIINSVIQVFAEEKLTRSVENAQQAFSFFRTKEEAKLLKEKSLDPHQMEEIDNILLEIADLEGDHDGVVNILYPKYSNIDHDQIKILIKSLKTLNCKDKQLIVYKFMYDTSKDDEQEEYLWLIIETSCQLNRLEDFITYCEITKEKYNSISSLQKLISIALSGSSSFNDVTESLLNTLKAQLTQDNYSLFYYLSACLAMKKKNLNTAYEHYLRIETDAAYSNNIEYLRSYAKTCYKLNNFKKAIKLYKSILKINSSDFESCLNIGESYLKQDNLPSAHKYLQFGLTLDAKEAEKVKMLFAYARLLYREKDLTNAITFFEKCIKLDKSSFRSYHNIALIYMEQNEVVKAKHNFEKCLEIQPQYFIAKYEILMLDLSTISDKQRLKQDFDNLIPNLPSHFLDYSKLLIETFNDTEQAVKYIKKSLSSKDYTINKYVEIVAVLVKKGVIKESIDLFTLLLKKSEKDYKLYLKICATYNKTQNYSTSIRFMKQYINENPPSFLALCEISVYYIKESLFEDAFNSLNDAEELYSNDFKYNGFLKNMSLCCLSLGKFDKALESINKHHMKYPEENNMLICAMISLSSGDDAKAESYLVMEKEMFPANEKLLKLSGAKDLEKISKLELFKV